jgi:hypothetical protein
MSLPTTVEEIIDHLARMSAAGKTVRLTPRTAALIETALRHYARLLGEEDDSRLPYKDPDTRELKFRIDMWDEHASTITATHGWLSDLMVSHRAFDEFCLTFPFDRLTLRHGAFLMREQAWSDRWATDASTLAKMAAWRARHRPVGGWKDGWGDEDSLGIALAAPAETMLALPAPREED